ncbi:MAG: hypothetical protein AAF432_14295 [Planctomycetota bacterium]
MPIRWSTLFRFGIVAVLAAHVFYMYCLARTMRETFGFDIGTVLVGSGFALLMLIPFLWAVCVPEFPEMVMRNSIGPRRVKQGRCPSCGYHVGASNSGTCPECGESTGDPEPYEWRLHVVYLFIAMNVMALVFGCALGEAYIRMDERQFERDVQAFRAQVDDSYVVARHRKAPGQGKMAWNQEAGFVIDRTQGTRSVSGGTTTKADSAAAKLGLQLWQ